MYAELEFTVKTLHEEGSIGTLLKWSEVEITVLESRIYINLALIFAISYCIHA